MTTDFIDKIPEKIVNEKMKKGKKYFLMTYKGLDSSHDTWIEESQVHDKQLIQEYYRKSKGSYNDEFGDYYVRHKHQPFVIEIPKLN